jgi:hypothetical protein
MDLLLPHTNGYTTAVFDCAVIPALPGLDGEPSCAEVAMSVADFSTSPASLAECVLLEARYNGPIPSRALADLRACPPQPLSPATIAPAQLAAWRSEALSSLKLWQRRLAERRTRLVAVRTVHACPAAAKAHAIELLRAEVRYALREINRLRATVRILAAHTRTLSAITTTLLPSRSMGSE